MAKLGLFFCGKRGVVDKEKHKLGWLLLRTFGSKGFTIKRIYNKIVNGDKEFVKFFKSFAKISVPLSDLPLTEMKKIKVLVERRNKAYIANVIRSIYIHITEENEGCLLKQVTVRGFLAERPAKGMKKEWVYRVLPYCVTNQNFYTSLMKDRKSTIAGMEISADLIKSSVGLLSANGYKYQKARSVFKDNDKQMK